MVSTKANYRRAYRAEPLGALDDLLHKIEDPIEKKACGAIGSELLTNLRKPSGNLLGLYAVPGGGRYQKSWLWDTAFISQIWLLINPDIAKEIVLTHTLSQLKNGMIPHIAAPGYKSSITQPPLLAWASWRIYEQTKDKHFISRIYPKLKLFNEWFYLTRNFGRNGLFSWIRSDESGWDDSPRFDGIRENQAPGVPPGVHWILRFLRIFMDVSRYSREPRLGNLNIRSIEALDLNCYLVAQMSSLARMAEVLGLGSDAEIFEGRVYALIRQIRSHLWDEEDSFFYDSGPEGFIKVPTPAAFLTLFAEVATRNQAEALIKHLADEKEFWTPYPIPSVAMNNPKFSLRYWRGPVWINVNYMVYLGLRKYGYDELAKELREKTIRMVVDLYARRGHFFEFYSPLTGDIIDLLPPEPARHFVGWTGLIINLLADKYSFSLGLEA